MHSMSGGHVVINLHHVTILNELCPPPGHVYCLNERRPRTMTKHVDGLNSMNELCAGRECDHNVTIMNNTSHTNESEPTDEHHSCTMCDLLLRHQEGARGGGRTRREGKHGPADE